MTSLASATEEWTELLDTLAAHLEIARASLAAGAPESLAFEAPHPTSPLPQPLAKRAQALLTATDELAAIVTEELARVRDELRSPPPPEAARTGSRIDVGA